MVLAVVTDGASVMGFMVVTGGVAVLGFVVVPVDGIGFVDGSAVMWDEAAVVTGGSRVVPIRSVV